MTAVLPASAHRVDTDLLISPPGPQFAMGGAGDEPSGLSLRAPRPQPAPEQVMRERQFHLYLRLLHEASVNETQLPAGEVAARVTRLVELMIEYNHEQRGKRPDGTDQYFTREVVRRYDPNGWVSNTGILKIERSVPLNAKIDESALGAAHVFPPTPVPILAGIGIENTLRGEAMLWTQSKSALQAMISSAEMRLTELVSLDPLRHDQAKELIREYSEAIRWDPLESTCRHASLSIL